MLYTNTIANERPDSVTLEALPEGTTRVILADNITEITIEEETAYQYDEVVFLYPDEGEPTAAGIEDEFDVWWEYGAQPEEAEPTLEERIDAVEEATAAIIDIIMGGENV